MAGREPPRENGAEGEAQDEVAALEAWVARKRCTSLPRPFEIEQARSFRKAMSGMSAHLRGPTTLTSCA